MAKVSAKQRANINRRKLQPAVAVLPPGQGLPDRAWWVGAPRDGFTSQAGAQVPRMASSRFGRTAGNNTFGDDAA